MKPWLFLVVALSLAACDTGYVPPPRFKDRPMPDLPDTRLTLAFTCAYEKDAIPPREPEADQLYRHARWLRKNNLLKEDPAVYPKIERLIRIATAWGHDKANLELRQMIGRGQADSDNPVKEALDLVDDLIRRGIPGGYYDMGRYLEKGYGVKQDKALAVKYYRKSADLGSPEGQYVVGDQLTGFNGQPAIQEIGKQIWRCAAEQGNGEAGLELGIDLKTDGFYSTALQAFQLGIRAGNDYAASFMQHGFEGPIASNLLHYLGQQKDDERARRYEAIGHVLSLYSYLNPKVPEIDAIVPLPPAKLPPWDGKLQWIKEHEANVPPPLPSEARIVEMARAKGLDPETGRPVAQKRSKAPVEPRADSVARLAAHVPLGTQAASGQTCPQTGTWVCSQAAALGGLRRVFIAGETLPGILVAQSPGLLQRLKGETDRRLVDTVWTLAEVPEIGKEG